MAAADMKVSLIIAGKDDGARRLIASTEAHLQTFGKKLNELGKNQGVLRSAKQIKSEIQEVKHQYDALARSGRVAGNDLARAAVAARKRISELNAELNQGVGLQAKFGKGMAVGGAMLAGGIAAYGTLNPAMDNAKQLDANVGQVARNAYVADGSKSAEWIAGDGKAEVRELARQWIAQYGGNADAALGFMNAQMAQGLSFDEIRKDKGRGYGAMTAMSQNGQYDYEGTASLYKTYKDAGLNGDALARAVEKTLQSGLDGKFEVDDVVREAPSLFANMAKGGMNATTDMDYMLAWMQSGANKTATPSEAANNIQNTLSKVLTSATAKNVKDELGRDWDKERRNGLANGENAVQVLARLINAKLGEDATYNKNMQLAAQGDINALKLAEDTRRQLVGAIMPDMQAQSGLIAAMDMEQMQKYMQSTQATDNGKLAKINQARMMDAAAQQEQADSLEILNTDVSGLVEAETALKQLTAEYPNATLAVQTLAAAATAAAGALGVMSLLNVGGAAGAGGLLKGGLAAAGAVALPVASAAVGVGLMWNAHDRINRNEGKRFFEGGIDSRGAGYAQSALGGAALGAAVGSVIPVIGTAVGAAIGGVGGLIHAAVTDAVREKPPVPPTAQTPAPPPAAAMPPVPAEPPEKLSPVIAQQTAAYQASIVQQTGEYTAAVQANAEAVGARIDQVSAALAAVNPTITNNVAVNLDGRVIANEVSRYQVAMFGRGAGQ